MLVVDHLRALVVIVILEVHIFVQMRARMAEDTVRVALLADAGLLVGLELAVAVATDEDSLIAVLLRDLLEHQRGDDRLPLKNLPIYLNFGGLERFELSCPFSQFGQFLEVSLCRYEEHL